MHFVLILTLSTSIYYLLNKRYTILSNSESLFSLKKKKKHLSILTINREILKPNKLSIHIYDKLSYQHAVPLYHSNLSKQFIYPPLTRK